jgi:hypothetical protein
MKPLEKKYRTYYIYHDNGYYDYLNGSFRNLTSLGIDYHERYDIVDNFGHMTLQECLDYMNRCRSNSSPKKAPIKVKRVIIWHCGMAKEVGTEDFWKTLYDL